MSINSIQALPPTTNTQHQTAGANAKYSSQMLRQTARQALQNISTTPGLDADLLMMHTLNCERSFLYAHPEYILNKQQYNTWQGLLERATQSEPIAYIRGVQEFYGLEFIVNPSVLIPRPETERLVDDALEYLPANKNCRVLDLGTGSGAIACALKHARQNWRIDATDISAAALQVARKNAATHDLAINFYQGNWFAAVAEHRHAYDFIISNPPYIAQGDPRVYPGAKFEPASALYAADHGLADLRTIAQQAPDYLTTGGKLVMEDGDF